MASKAFQGYWQAATRCKSTQSDSSSCPVQVNRYKETMALTTSRPKAGKCPVQVERVGTTKPVQGSHMRNQPCPAQLMRVVEGWKKQSPKSVLSSFSPKQQRSLKPKPIRE